MTNIYRLDVSLRSLWSQATEGSGREEKNISHRVHRVLGPKLENNLRDFRDLKRLKGAGERIRIILLASGDLWAGAEAVVYNLAKGLKDYPSVELMVVILNEGKLADLCKIQGINTHIISENKNNFPILVWHLRRLTRDFKPHIVHSHRYKENVLASLAKPFMPFPKLVTTIHGLSEGHGKFKTRIASRLNFFVLRFFFDKVVSVSKEISRNFIQQKAFSHNKVSTIHNGIEVPKPKMKPTKNRNGFTVGSAGRFFPIKDYGFMVDIARNVCEKRDDVQFVLAGDGPERTSIVSRIKAYGLDDKFKLLGHLDNMEEFYSSIDIYLNTSRHEGIPITILEAMAYEIPVIAPKVGGLQEVVEDQKTGYLVEDRNPSEFAKVLEELISQKSILESMGRKSREKFEECFSLDSMVGSYVKIYETLAALKQGKKHNEHLAFGE